MEKLKSKEVSSKKIKNTSVSFSKSKFHQFSFTEYSDEHMIYSDYKGYPILEEISNNPWTDSDFNCLSIITKNLIDDTPMDNNSLSKLKCSFEKDLDDIINSFPESSSFVSDLEIIIHYNDYGSTFLEWKFYFSPKKFKKFKKNGGIEVLFDFLIEFDFQNFDNVFQTLYDIQLLNGDLLYDVISNEDEEEIKYYFEIFIEKNIEFGYELETIDYYVENYGVEKEIVNNIINNILVNNNN
jgi:hypothetical protein